MEESAARLYRCLELYPGFGGTGLEDGENLVWSVVAKLKEILMEPLEEPTIKELLANARISG